MNTIPSFLKHFYFAYSLLIRIVLMHIARTNILKEKQKKVKTRSMHTISICTDPI